MLNDAIHAAYCYFKLGNSKQGSDMTTFYRIGDESVGPDSKSLKQIKSTGKRLKYPKVDMMRRPKDTPVDWLPSQNAGGVMDMFSPDRGYIRICCISDTHNSHEAVTSLPKCDILIHAGDIMMTGRHISQKRAIETLVSFNEWLGHVPATHKFIIGGNHDAWLQKLGKEEVQKILTNGKYLCNSYVEVMGLRIFGTPLSSGRSGNDAFQTDKFQRDTLNVIKNDIILQRNHIDILVTHGPSHTITNLVKPRIMHVWGHVHEFRGLHRDAASSGDSYFTPTDGAVDSSWRYPWTHNDLFGPYDGDLNLIYKHASLASESNSIEYLSVCACIMDKSYDPVHLPITIDVPISMIQKPGPDSCKVVDETCSCGVGQKDELKSIQSAQTIAECDDLYSNPSGEALDIKSIEEAPSLDAQII